MLENGQVSLRFETGLLKDVLEKAILTVQAGNARVLTVHRNLDEPLTLTTDLDRLGQVFINLIANAGKYCDAAAPELKISVQLDGADTSVVFADNGTPIPEVGRALIFEKFARISDQDGSGAGLGLAICREIMTRLGGDVSYEPGRAGNTFIVHLPRQKALAAQ